MLGLDLDLRAPVDRAIVSMGAHGVSRVGVNLNFRSSYILRAHPQVPRLKVTKAEIKKLALMLDAQMVTLSPPERTTVLAAVAEAQSPDGTRVTGGLSRH